MTKNNQRKNLKIKKQMLHFLEKNKYQKVYKGVSHKSNNFFLKKTQKIENNTQNQEKTTKNWKNLSSPFRNKKSKIPKSTTRSKK